MVLLANKLLSTESEVLEEAHMNKRQREKNRFTHFMLRVSNSVKVAEHRSAMQEFLAGLTLKNKRE
jgi:hypothetical protein